MLFIRTYGLLWVAWQPKGCAAALAVLQHGRSGLRQLRLRCDPTCGMWSVVLSCGYAVAHCYCCMPATAAGSLQGMAAHDRMTHGCQLLLQL
jgi:hypothetical protein